MNRSLHSSINRDRPILRDCTQIDYDNKIKGHDILMEMAVFFGIEKVEVKTKDQKYKQTTFSEY